MLHTVWLRACTAGKLYDPNTRLIAGLKPAHFLTLATPHMGCDGEGPAQVIFQPVFFA